LAEKGDVRRGMHWMLRGLEITEELGPDEKEAQLLAPIIRLNLGAWGKCVYAREKYLPHGGWVWDLAFTPDQRFVITASRDRTVQVWDAKPSEPTGEPLTHFYPVWGLALHPDGQTMFTISADKGTEGELRVYRVDPAKPGHYVQRGPAVIFTHDLFRLSMN